jgi:tetratricopeptide (TPR) repeat protein
VARQLFGQDAPPDLDYMSALCCKHQGRYEEALAHIEAVLEGRPGHLHAWFQRGYLLEQLERFEDARGSYRKALEQSPGHRPSRYRLAMVLRSLERREESQEILESLSAQPKQAAEDSEKCDLTAVTLRPPSRARYEPPEVALSFRNITEELLGGELAEGVSVVTPLWRGGRAVAPSVSVQWGNSVIDGDGRGWLVELLLAGAQGARILRLEEDRPPSPRETLPVQMPGDIRAAAAPDLDNDGRAEVLLLSARGGLLLYRQDDEGLFRGPPSVVTSADGSEPVEMASLDMDHDGDLDIVLLERRGDSYQALLLRNNGDGSFTRVAPWESLEAPAETPVSFAAHDVDQANDLDLVVAGGAGGVQAFLNLRGGNFERVVLPELGIRTRILVEDLSGDGAPDFFAAGGEPGWALAENGDPPGAPRRLRIREPQSASDFDGGTVHDACLGDLDNDGDLDVLLAGDRGVGVLRNVRGGVLRKDKTVGLPGGEGARRVLVSDLTGDGRLEVLTTTSAGRLVVLSTEGSPAYASWSVVLRGKRDNSNAIGTVVEQYAGTLYQSVLVRRPGPLHLGLGIRERTGIDGLRLRWPQGIVQSIPSFEIEPDARGRVRFTQAESVVSSCPFLYVHGADGWRFSTDILGMAPLDEWLPGDRTPQLCTEELVRLPEDFTPQRGGRVEIAVTEELRETAYLDRLQLLAVDHPSDVAVYVDESTRSAGGKLPRLAVVPQAGLEPPASLSLPDGTEATELARESDGRYAHGYGAVRPQWGGWVPRYGLDLVTGSPTRALLLTGRLAWYDSTVTYALAQHGRTWGPLRLERLAEEGDTIPLLADLGLPAGMDRTMVVELPGEGLEAGSRLRLSGQHRFLWDRILSARDLEWVAVTREGRRGRLSWTTREVARATLGFHGFSRRSGDRQRHEQRYHYEDAGPRDAFPPATGFATRYGDVIPLLEKPDDLLVVLVAGDGVEVEFDTLAPPAGGLCRTFFVRVSGWAKEGSFHNATGGTIEPLPFRGMSCYPPHPGEGRQDAAYRAYLERFQTREVRRRVP